MSNFLSRIGVVSAWTLISRVLGLARDMLTSAVFGTTIWNSAFVTAFMIPNLFRRLLGEGALTAALMPNLGRELEEGGREAVYRLVNKTLSWLLVVSVSLTLVATVVYQIIENQSVSEKWVLGASLGKILFPYVILICLAAIISAALNLLDKFGVPALTAVWLNSSVLISLGLGGWYWGGDLEEKMMLLCAGVLVGGSLQLLAPVVALMKEGWRPSFDFAVSDRLRNVIWLTAPGIIGAAVHQINVMVSRGLAFAHSDQGAALLYYANRLVELPVGVFAIAIATVVFPSLSKSAANDDRVSFQKTYVDGLVFALMMAIPAMVGLAILSKEIIETLFQHGVFNSADTNALVPVVCIYALGIPILSFVSIETRAFFSLKDTKTPVRAAAVAMVVNLLFSLLLMIKLGIIGLAVASNIALGVQAFVLYVALRKKQYATSLRALSSPVAKIAMGAIVMGVCVWLSNKGLSQFEIQFRSLIAVATLIPLGGGIFFLVLKFLKLPQLDEVVEAIFKR